MIRDFFGRLGKQPDQRDRPGRLCLDARRWTLGQGIFVGRHLGPNRLPYSFYRFLIRMGIVTSNPCDRLEGPKAQPNPPRDLSADEVRRLLSVIPASAVGLRDRAIMLTLVLTGRRRTEVIGLKAGDIATEV